MKFSYTGTASLYFAALLLVSIPFNNTAYGDTDNSGVSAEQAALPKPEPFKKLIAQADAGDSAAQFELGQRLILGEGLPQDTKTALRLLASSAEGGVSKAAIYLANQYRLGAHVPQDPASMLRWYEKAANNGDPVAAYELGHLYETGKAGVTIDTRKSKEWFDKALPLMEAAASGKVEKDNADLAFWTGTMYSRGKGAEPSTVKAFSWWQKAALAGHALAQRYVGLAYLRGTGVETNYEDALNWISRAAAQGEPGAAMDMVVATARAKGYPEAEKVLDSLAKTAAPHNQLEIASYYREGKIVPANLQKAFYWTTQAAASGSPDAQCLLGIAYLNGEGTEKSYIKAYKSFKAASEQGNEEAEENLSTLMQLGLSILAIALSILCMIILLILRGKKKKELGREEAIPGHTK